MKDGCMDKDAAYFVEKSQLYGFNPTQHTQIQWLEGMYDVWRAAEVGVEDVLQTVVDICQDVKVLTKYLGVDVGWCKKQDTTFHSQLTTAPATSEGGLCSEGSLKNKRCILVGQLTTGLSDHPGQLVISDSTSSIPVEVRYSDCEVMGLLHQWAVFPSWNLIITRRGKRYLELCAKPEVVRSSSHQPLLCRPIPVVSAKTASTLLLHKDTLKSGCVDMVATVEAVGEIHRVKTDLLFCIRLQHGVNIIVKKQEFLHWQKFLMPGDKKIFTAMRPTTLKKGAGSSIKVFVPWKGSKLFSPTSVDHNCVSLQEWLRGQGDDEHERVTLEEMEEEEEGDEQKKEDNNLASYQGVVTSDELAYLGIYILDTKVGLCVSCVPAVHKYQFLRVGSKVIIHNAHFSRSEQFPHTRVVCCTSSCVKVMEFSSLDNKPQMVNLPVILQQVMKKSCITRGLLDTFINFASCLHRKLARSFHHELTSILETTFEYCCTPDCDMVGRVYIREFLSGTHQCGLVQNQDGNGVYTVAPDMSEFTQEMSCLVTGADNLSSDSATYWGYHHQLQGMPHKILVGVLDLSSKNGRVQLRDDTGSIDCLITMTTSSERHVCTEICCCGDLKPGSNFRCPFLHSCCVGAVVAVTKFTVIREQFTGLNNSLNNLKMTDSDPTHSDVWYVVFSMLNAVLIHRPTVCKTPQDQVPHKRGKVDQGRTGQPTDEGRQLVLINHRETLVLDRRVYSGSRFRMAVHGHILHNTGGDSLNWDVIESLQKQHSQQHHVHNGYTDVDKHQSVLKAKSENSLSPAVIFLFQNDAVRWCHTIVPGGVYRILVPTQKLCPTGPGSWQLKKAMAKAGGRSVHEVPVNAQLFRVFPNKTPSDAGVGSTGNLPIKTIVMERCEATLVGFEGQIVRRCPVESDGHHTSTKRTPDHPSDSQLGVGSPDGCGVKVVVKCQRSGDEVDVYFNLDSFVYPLGLLPGVGVCLERVERKVSRKNNVYCQFIAVSCLHIQHLTDLASEIPTPTHSPETGPLRLVYLADLWRNNIKSSPFPVCCHVQRFLKVSLKWVCHQCGSVCVGGACCNPGCRADHSTRFLARASVIVEDGTSVAIVTVRDAAVQKLLLLSDREWSSLQSVVHTEGEVFLQKTRPEFSSQVEMFVHHLCDSSLVKKDWEMWLRIRTGVSTDWSSGGSLDDMSLDEFSLKNVDSGLATIETRCLPFLQLDCVEVKKIDYRKWTLICLK
ncbi:CST complex subunit CTC1-like [Pecten maximus]|uniref:CST complex subunit CTC1-like n=1 Tax=Pecten maximus TaxID=6579 RepID=UPI001458525C|nr:CST complex subunit CTC1-like [Pecten maximus]